MGEVRIESTFREFLRNADKSSESRTGPPAEHDWLELVDPILRKRRRDGGNCLFYFLFQRCILRQIELFRASVRFEQL